MATVSTKGQLPAAIRKRRDRDAGTRLIVEETPEGVLLKRAPAIAPTRSDHVLGMLPFAARPKSLEDREAARLAEARCTMIAVDTDTVLRHPTGDHPEQSARTRQTGGGQHVWRRCCRACRNRMAGLHQHSRDADPADRLPASGRALPPRQRKIGYWLTRSPISRVRANNALSCDGVGTAPRCWIDAIRPMLPRSWFCEPRIGAATALMPSSDSSGAVA
ncbi:hypothetical protein SAMN04244548_04681 [Paracoccus pantotrophus]|nr:hypothetical protein SAMN04244548_04681 [Paracoccus pantotrophus]